MKKIVLMFLVLVVMSAQAELRITGVVDGPLSGGIPKGMELYADVAIADLSIYGVGSENSAAGGGIEEFTFPADAIPQGTFIYVASEQPGFNTFFGFDPNYTSGAMGINGDDAVELFKNGSVIDTFGDVNFDGTGSTWEYLDGWAYRINNTLLDPSVNNTNNYYYSGINALDGETTNATAATPFPIGTYTIPEPAIFGLFGLALLFFRRK